MWKLHKPKLSDAKNDIIVVVSHCNNLEESGKFSIEVQKSEGVSGLIIYT